MSRKKYIVSETDKQIVYDLRLQNCTIEQIIDKLGISQGTYYANHNEFVDVLKKAEALSDIEKLRKVKDKQFERAIGTKLTEKEYTVNPETNELVLKTVKEKEVLPDVTAQIFYLVNKSNGEYVSINNSKEITNYIPTPIIIE